MNEFSATTEVPRFNLELKRGSLLKCRPANHQVCRREVKSDDVVAFHME